MIHDERNGSSGNLGRSYRQIVGSIFWDFPRCIGLLRRDSFTPLQASLHKMTGVVADPASSS